MSNLLRNASLNLKRGILPRTWVPSTSSHLKKYTECHESARKECYPLQTLWCSPLRMSGQGNPYDQQLRYYRSGRINRSTDQHEDSGRSLKPTPQLMDFPWVIWPRVWFTIKNWILSNLLIYRYLDQEFSLSSFKNGSIQALTHVSQELSTGNFEALEGLVTTPTLEEIQKNFSKFSLKQRLDLAVEKEDIFFSFPYQIGIIFTNEGSQSERIFVEITMCYHIFRGFQDFLKSKAEGTSGGFKGVYDNHDRISIANYRFIREFTKGVDDDWTISLANHFKPGEMVQGQ